MKRPPHDELFKKVFSEPEHARGFLEGILSEKIQRKVRWETLSLVPGSFVDTTLSPEHTDLLFQVDRRSKGKIAIYILFEHQSSVDDAMPFRILSYMVRIWDRLRNEEDGKRGFSPILPVVLHHGSTRWNAATAMQDIYERPDDIPDDLMVYLPSFRFQLVDLVDISEAGFRGTVFGKLTLALLKSAHTGRLLARIPDWARWIHEVWVEHGRDALRIVVEYILRAEAITPTPEAFQAALSAVTAEIREEAMTLMDVIEARGHAKGRNEGRNEGRSEGRIGTLRRLVERKYPGTPAGLSVLTAWLPLCDDSDADWILDHAGENSFEDFVAGIEQRLKARGVL